MSVTETNMSPIMPRVRLKQHHELEELLAVDQVRF
jgi:hypothetical protein